MRLNVRNLLASSLPLVVLGARKRDVSPSATFQLYAYGDSFGGLPLFYADGLAYIGDPSLFNSSEAAVVIFTIDSEHHFIGNPNSTLSNVAPSWSNITLFVPEPSSGDKRVGFLPPNNGTGNSTTQTSGFAFYGSTAMLLGDNGSIATSFSGMKLQDSGVYELFWNETQGTVPVTLRRVRPSTTPKKMTSESH
ncbi:hypothetical protein J4E91_010520 [Alternaria rosae]|uniref:uncharacterized protein n=1 Tax=Alternaria rosae TaxID=1187941 RepID=UPI001E8E5FA6|nr:uncharacterized protein BKA58DRAFT_95885 [Alternaria rosae]KAH6878441.1 hypothetical protein BKA58DRAFT_95885 [Alternaria rosae]KAI4941970.1 hypothetical protein J4E91_010520 [Alternaria rosae]